MSDFEQLLRARDEHFADGAEHEMWIVRHLDGIAIGLRCQTCHWRYWRAGYEPRSAAPSTEGDRP